MKMEAETDWCWCWVCFGVDWDRNWHGYGGHHYFNTCIEGRDLRIFQRISALTALPISVFPVTLAEERAQKKLSQARNKLPTERVG